MEKHINEFRVTLMGKAYQLHNSSLLQGLLSLRRHISDEIQEYLGLCGCIQRVQSVDGRRKFCLDMDSLQTAQVLAAEDQVVLARMSVLPLVLQEGYQLQFGKERYYSTER